METIEPLYEDITLSPNALTTKTMVPTEPNEAYAVRKTTKHVNTDDMRMEDNEAYAVRKTTKYVNTDDMQMEDNEAYTVRNVTSAAPNIEVMENYEKNAVKQKIGKHVTVQNIAMEDNEAYQVLF